MTSSVRRNTNIAKHKEKILGVINQLNEEELEQVSELLKKSEAGAEDNEDKVDELLEEEYA
jgi:negative regulator of genetic competence, sporulation and motility